MSIPQTHLPILNPASAKSQIEWSGVMAEAAREVFEIMVGAKLTLAEGEDQRHAGVTAMLGFAGAPCGVLSIRCPWDAAAAIAARMLGSTLQELSPEEVCDALGEICNMVAGSIKTRLPKAGEGCMMSIPTVVRGVDYEVRCLACNCCFSIVMEFDGQAVIFHLELQS